jgi:hypothetical protein
MSAQPLPYPIYAPDAPDAEQKYEEQKYEEFGGHPPNGLTAQQKLELKIRMETEDAIYLRRLLKHLPRNDNKNMDVVDEFHTVDEFHWGHFVYYINPITLDVYHTSVSNDGATYEVGELAGKIDLEKGIIDWVAESEHM